MMLGRIGNVSTDGGVCYGEENSVTGSVIDE